ncbi:MAG: hypothetical protein H8E36_15285 [Rhodospirillaceae bacterium]|nr:hypothetical protein [Rhodospirillaceae bacterium]MBL6929890.1 hypothetical protein [Rhodospirillales bacterium]
MKKLVFEHSSHPEFNPRCLVDAAIEIDRARKDGNKGFLIKAVDHNRKLWVYIHSLAAHSNRTFSEETCSELTRLSDYVWSATKGKDANISDMVLDTLINIDLQISEGLLYSNKH